MSEVKTGITYNSCIKRGFIIDIKPNRKKALEHYQTAETWIILSKKAKCDLNVLTFDCCKKAIIHVSLAVAFNDGFDIKKMDCALKYLDQIYSKKISTVINLSEFISNLIKVTDKKLYEINYYDAICQLDYIYDNTINVFYYFKKQLL